MVGKSTAVSGACIIDHLGKPHVLLGYAEGLDDVYRISVADLKKVADDIEKKYGKRAILHFDAGYNNISCRVLKPLPKKRKKK